MNAENTIRVPPPPDQPNPTDRDVTDKEQHAAQTIQRVYRGYRTRRELRGLGLSQQSQNATRLIEVKSPATAFPPPNHPSSLTQPCSTGRQRSRMASNPSTLRARRHQRSR
ncbi:hypothetical protein BP00DRAFT_54902 [Aspergillus indologenus CBS 114.80]|uniref:Uncharacterized protein n=1 Tax=Aspergillus indologenus CBS 114.80 TaxID=1450541 RepID=A0A2V5IJX8_9EURO|nr:hypothetical protein BP00DRAFT_54902 [Aspergillus indologenus CBS 114.80]